ncbi:hypothetical protein DPMN_138231 [Dreissena polymorpha]|uniref:C1q domain-containing protein n=1 Tax=Dreissena polymorpha TaxID=45954 RepID=A0A9D4G3V2_DREPO|nr:hypothetical protein DPMN_138231 [Dreissena polymorpha]
MFKDVMANEGASFEPNTGQFTASVPGVYMFIVQYCPDTSKWAFLSIVSERGALIRSAHKGKTSGMCVSMQTKVLIGEKVWVQCTSPTCKIYGVEG